MEVPVVEHLSDRVQSGGHALDGGYAGLQQSLDRRLVMGPWKVGHHHHRFVGAPVGFQQRVEPRLGDPGIVAGTVCDGTDRGAWIGHQGGERLLKDALKIVAGAPHVERVDGEQAGIEEGFERLGGVRLHLGKTDARIGREIDEELALVTGVEACHEPTGADPAPAHVGEQAHARAERLECRDAANSVAIKDRLVGRLVAGNRSRVTQRERDTGLGSPDLESHHRDVQAGGFLERGDERLSVADGFENQADDPGGSLIERVVDVVGDRYAQLLAGRDRQVEAEPPVVQ